MEEREVYQMHHIPNILSGFRISLIPFFIYQVLMGNMLTAGIILIISAITDIVDGYLARRFKWVTDLGKILDPAADKLTQVSICVLFVVQFTQFWVFFVVLILRDLVMLVAAGYFVKHKMPLTGARWFGKISTVVFFISMIFIALFPGLPLAYVYILLALTTFSAVIALIMYVPEFVRFKRKRLHSDNPKLT